MYEYLSITKSLMVLNKSILTCNYTRAAEQLGMQQPNVSAIIHDFEKRLGVKLFSSTAHGVVPTEAALALNQYALKLQALFHDVQNYSLETHQYSGTIRLWMTDGLGSFCLASRLIDFCSQFPSVQLDITCSCGRPNILARETDIAIVDKAPKSHESAIIGKYNIQFGLFASPDYIRKFGAPKDMEDLIKNHYICDRKANIAEWKDWDNILAKAQKVIAVSNSTNMLIQLSCLGLGIGIHPLHSGQEEHGLINVLPQFTLKRTYWLISHIDAKNTPKVRCMLTYLKNILESL